MYSEKSLNKYIVLVLGLIFAPFFCFAETLFFDNFDSYTTDLSGATAKWKPYIGTNLSAYKIFTNIYSTSPNSISKGASYISKICSQSMTLPSEYYISMKVNFNTTELKSFPIIFHKDNNCNGQSSSGMPYFSVYYNPSGQSTIALVQGGSVLESVNITKPEVNTWHSLTFHKKANNTASICFDGVCSSYKTITTTPIVSATLLFENASNVYFDDFLIGTESPLNGKCGIADGRSYPLSVPEADMCQIGYSSAINIQILGDNVFWNWNCTGGNGVKDYCQATMGNEPQEPTCGASHEGFFNNAPSSGLCATGFYLNNSIMETMDGWIWTCGGLYSPTNIQCEAFKNIINYPDIPELEDCESYPFLEKMVCQIKNLFQSAFTPSASKIKELNQALYGIRNKAPFNYLYSVQNIGNQNINEEQNAQFCIMGNCGNIDVLEVLSTPIKILASFLFSIAFIFWGINYIKRFFL